jgi:hypothetical protein
VWAGIGAYRQSPEQTIEKIELSRKMGVDGFTLFAYGSIIRPPEDGSGVTALKKIAPVVKR